MKPESRQGPSRKIDEAKICSMEGIMDANQVMGADAGNIVLAVSLELSAAQWKVALHDGLRERPAVHAVGAPQLGSGCKAFWI